MYKAKKIVGSVFIALLIACLLLSVVGIGYYTDGFTNFVKDSAAPVDVVPAKEEQSFNTGFEVENGDVVKLIGVYGIYAYVIKDNNVGWIKFRYLKKHK